MLRAGLATAPWITVDDTSARHAHQDGYTTQIGDDRFTAFRTGRSKSREAFLATLRAGHSDYIINEEALAYMRPQPRRSGDRPAGGCAAQGICRQRRMAERTIAALWDAVGALLDQFTPAECANYFKAAGYDPD